MKDAPKLESLEDLDLSRLTPEEAQAALELLTEVVGAAGALPAFQPKTDSPPPVEPGPEEKVRRAEERFRAVTEQVPAVIFIASLEDDLSEAFVSPQIEEMLGFTQEEWVSDPVLWYRQIHPEDKDRWSAEAAHILRTGEPLKSVYRVLSKDGRIVWVRVEVRMSRDANGRPRSIRGVAFDISEIKQAETNLRRYTQELLARNEELAQIAYVSAHDLQTPLRHIHSYTQLLAEKYGAEKDPETRKWLDFILEGAARMRQLITDVQTYTSVERTEIHPERVRLNRLAEEVLETLSDPIREAGAKVDVGSLPELEVLPGQIERLLQNLIENGLKFRKPDVPPEIGIAAHREGNRWRIEVRDNGIGIEPQYADRIFKMFQRLHTTDRYPGTGIGLAVCKKIVELHGGKIRVESDGKTGSTFCVELPLHHDWKTGQT